MDKKERYIHLSKKKIKNLYTNEQTISYLPKGIWFSKEKKWIDYIDKNTSKDISGNIYVVDVKYPIVKKLSEESKDKILKIGTQKSLDKFIEKYKNMNKIDWIKVSENNAGIIFDPYFYDENMKDEKYKWYSMLNVISGCIWNKDCIDIDLIWEQNKVEKKKKVRFRNSNLEKLCLS